jgi:hypothetical protein
MNRFQGSIVSGFSGTSPKDPAYTSTDGAEDALHRALDLLLEIALMHRTQPRR